MSGRWNWTSGNAVSVVVQKTREGQVMPLSKCLIPLQESHPGLVLEQESAPSWGFVLLTVVGSLCHCRQERTNSGCLPNNLLQVEVICSGYFWAQWEWAWIQWSGACCLIQWPVPQPGVCTLAHNLVPIHSSTTLGNDLAFQDPKWRDALLWRFQRESICRKGCVFKMSKEQ